VIEVPFHHVAALCDDTGIFEHADGDVPRRNEGYCTDDVARLLVVLVREPVLDRTTRELARTSLRFLARSQSVTGRTRNRCSATGRWEGRYGVEDCWGRSLWAYGTAARRAPEEWMRSSARSYFTHGAQQRSPHRRAMAFAALGAAEVLAVDPRDIRARQILVAAVDLIGAPTGDEAWPWPEPRLSYADAAVAESLIAAGAGLERADVVEHGLGLLAWLLERQTLDGHLSPTPVGGTGPGDVAPRFDQQAIEVAALADACERAFALTGDSDWRRGLEMAIGWFEGSNDVGISMWDPSTGAGYDGLTPTGRNTNRGAESTLAALSTMQHARRLEAVAALT
jgi:hypothetical protein